MKANTIATMPSKSSHGVDGIDAILLRQCCHVADSHDGFDGVNGFDTIERR
jgi:hypothetical protein